MEILVTFDIDGTLIAFGGESAKHPMAFRDAINELYSLNITELPEKYINQNTAGWTDALISKEMIKKSGRNPSQEEMQKMQMIVEKNFISSAEPNFNVLPGVPLFLSKLNEISNLKIGLATGNYEKIAWRKLELCKLIQYFPDHFGGFGTSFDRKTVITDAYLNGLKINHNSDFKMKIHIGDTSNDAISAGQADFKAMIVTTGRQKDGFPPNAYVFTNFEKDLNEMINFINSNQP